MNPKSIKSDFSQFRFYIHGNWPRMVWLAQISDPLCLVNAIFSSGGERKKEKKGMECVTIVFFWDEDDELLVYLEFVGYVLLFQTFTPMTFVLFSKENDLG